MSHGSLMGSRRIQRSFRGFNGRFWDSGDLRGVSGDLNGLERKFRGSQERYRDGGRVRLFFIMASRTTNLNVCVLMDS